MRQSTVGMVMFPEQWEKLLVAEYEACKLHFKLDSHIKCNNRYIDSKDGVYILSREILASTAVR